MAGLLCAYINPSAMVLEATATTPDKHKAILRFRTPTIPKLIGVPAKRVVVHKAVWFDGKEQPLTIAAAHQYSEKVTGSTSSRSINRLMPSERHIPTQKIVATLASQITGIRHNSTVASINSERIVLNDDTVIHRVGVPVVSTLPMPVLAMITGMACPNTFFEPIYANHFVVPNCDAYCTIYFPGASTPIYRASIHKNTVIIESNRPPTPIHLEEVFAALGIGHKSMEGTVIDHRQPYGKLLTTNQSHRKNFILQQTLENNIYSLGRFATWRPGVMLDDVVEDVSHIRDMINDGHYAAKQHKQEENK